MIFKTDSQVKVGAEEDTGLYHMERSVQQTNQVLNTLSFIFDQCPLHASKNLERRKQLILQDCHMPRQMTAGVRQWGGGQTMGAEPTQLLPRALTIQNDEVVTISMNNVTPSLLRENVGPSLSTKLSPRIRNQSKTKPFPEQNDAGGPTCKEIKTSQSKPSITQECPHPKPHSAQCFK